MTVACSDEELKHFDMCKASFNSWELAQKDLSGLTKLCCFENSLKT